MGCIILSKQQAKVMGDRELYRGLQSEDPVWPPTDEVHSRFQILSYQYRGP